MIHRRGLPKLMRSELQARSLLDLYKPDNYVSQDLGSIGPLAAILPDIIDACVFIFCSDHGVAAEDVTTLPQDFAAMSYNTFSKGEGIPFSLGKCFDIKVAALDCSLGCPTEHIAYCNAMTTREYLKCLHIGWKAVVGTSSNLIGIGEVGAGGTTTATALASILLDIDPERLLGHGSGISDSQLKTKSSLIKLAVNRVKNTTDIVSLMSQIGGKEIVSMVGAILGSYSRGKVVVLDGFITCVAGLIAETLFPGVSSCFLCCTKTNEPGQKFIADQIGLDPFMHIGHSCGMGLGCFFSIQACKASLCLSKK